MIYRLQPNRVRRAYYGGNHIDELRGHAPQVGRMPEEWIASCAAAFNPDAPKENEGYSILTDGTLLKDRIAADPQRMLGSDTATSMCFLLKLLDAAERLVIQVHPTREFARKAFDSAFGKTECWYALRDGGAVYIGFREGISRAQWEDLFEKQDVAGMLNCLHRFPLKKGELVFVPGGVPHAIDAGCFVVELQEPTDLMVIPERVTPSGIQLAEQKLHNGLGYERMFDCFVYDGLSAEETKRRLWVTPKKQDDVLTVLLDEDTTEQFRMMQLDVSTDYTLPMNGCYGAAVVLAGHGLLNGQSVSAGDTLFVAADTELLQAQGTFTLLLCTE